MARKLTSYFFNLTSNHPASLDIKNKLQTWILAHIDEVIHEKKSNMLEVIGGPFSRMEP